MEPNQEPVATPQPNIWYRVARLLPGVVAVCSGLALVGEVSTRNYLGLGVSGLGLAGAALYYHRRHQRRPIEVSLTLFWVWALVQLPSALLTTPAGSEPLWEVSQLVSSPFYMGFRLESGNVLRLGVNLFAFVLFAWIRRLRIAENFGE